MNKDRNPVILGINNEVNSSRKGKIKDFFKSLDYYVKKIPQGCCQEKQRRKRKQKAAADI